MDMPDNTIPKFWVTFEGRQYGARFLTIAEQAQCQVEVDRLTNGRHGEWVKSGAVETQVLARSIEVATQLNKVIVVWPTDVPKVDFLQEEDFDLTFGLWEAYGTAVKTFRDSKRPQNGSTGVGEGKPASPVVPDVLPPAA